MTDEEMKRLEDLAKERDLYSFAFEATPEAVLALIERVRKAEAALKCDHGDEREYCAKAFNEAVDRAERKGAEEMRSRCANEVQASGDIADLAETHGYRELEALVRSIPLPGDAP